MLAQLNHPTREELSAYSLGQLSEAEAVAIDRHISDCEPCCETIVALSSDDTFVGLLKEARQLPTDQTVDQDNGSASLSSTSPDVPAPLAEHPRYEILGLIGKGGMGDVYKARHRMMERTVALKIIKRELMRKPEAVDRFHREVKAAAQLAHPNIVTAHDAEQAGDVHFMVMEFVDGVDLSQMVEDQGALPVADACHYIRQAAMGLQHAHECGMVHRDIKPHNLMVTLDGTVKILDFGLASLAPEAIADADTVEARGDLTAAGAIMGTPDFISPEQADDARKADIRSDIYSLGATLYFLLTGRPLFADGSVMHKLKSHAQAEPEPLESLRDDVPAELVAVATKMTAKNPDYRFQTPAEVAEALKPFSQSAEPREIVEPRTQAEPRRWKPTFLSLTAVVALFVAAVFAGVIYYVLTDHGVVRVEVTDPSLEVTIKDHTITMRDGDGKPLTIRPGEQTLIVRKDDADFEFETDRFQIRRGDQIAFKVEMVKGEIVVRKDGGPFDRAPLLVGTWVGKYDADEELRLTLNAKGTFEMAAVDPANPQRVKAPWTGTYKADFTLSPARLDLDGTKIYAASDPETAPAPEDDGPADAAAAAAGPEPGTVKRHKIEVIIELIDANTLRMSDPEDDTRPKEFGEGALVLHKQRFKRIDGPAKASPMLTLEKAGQQRSDNQLQMPLCWCPAGEFRMGRKQLPVTLTRGFWMGKYEVTQAQYETLMGENPSENKGESLPVEKVAWKEAKKFCQKFTELERKAGRLPRGWEYRLPTEAQWEYACRADTTLVWDDEKALVYPSTFGDDLSELGDYAWYSENSDGTPHPVGQKKPNAWGLCDMHGNVREWVRDAWQSKLSGGKDPEVDVGSPIHAYRGGDWLTSAEPCGSPFIRGFGVAGREAPHMKGFRVALVSVDESGDGAAAVGDLGLLLGDWNVTSYTENGEKLFAADKGVGMQLQIKGDTLAMMQIAPNGEKSEKEWGRIELSSTTNPKSIDIIDPDSPDDRLLGIYELKDRALKICFVEQSNIDAARGRPVKRPTTFDAPAGSERVLIECRRKRPEENTDASAPRTILDQGYTILDGGKEIGSRRLVVTESDQALSIAEETSLALTFDGAPLGIVELDVSAVYSVAGDTPRIMRATHSAKEQGSLLMHGTVEFSSEETIAKWTTYKDGGRKLEPPKKQQATLKQPPAGPLMLDSAIQVVGPLLLPEDGEREFVRIEFNDEAGEGEALVAYEAGWRLRRTTRTEEAGFTITVFEPDSDKPEMAWEYDSQGNCESVQLTPTTFMKPHDAAAASESAPTIEELLRRESEGLLNPVQLDDLVDLILEYQADRTRPWRTEMGDLIEKRWVDGKLDRDRWEQYTAQFLVDTYELKVRPRIVIGSGEMAVQRVMRDARCGSGKHIAYQIRETNEITRIGSTVVGRVNLPSTRPISHETGGRTSTRYYLEDQESWATIKPGKHMITWEVELDVLEAPGIEAVKRTDVFASRKVTFETQTTFLPAGQSTVNINTDPDLKAAVEAAITLKRVETGPVDIPNTNNRFYANIVLDFKPRPIDTAFTIVLKHGENEYEAGSVAFPAAERSGFNTLRPRIPADLSGKRIDVILRPDTAAAEATIDCFEIWGEEIVFNDVLVQ